MPHASSAAIDQEFLAAGLEPLDPYTRLADERRCRCLTCGTTRFVRLRTLRRQGVACHWCHGWEKWLPWSIEARALAATWKSLGTPEDAHARLRLENLAPLTEVGDLYQPVGVLCLVCGETLVTVPERIRPDQPGWFGCQRCYVDRNRRVRADAPELFRANGLELHGDCSGEYVTQRARCLTCGVERLVSYHDLQKGSAPLCWTCTHGIRPDEPHRVYLFHFPALGVFKVGLTHNRHDRRMFQHIAGGGTLVDSVVVYDREAARRLEALLKLEYQSWITSAVGPSDFPQGGWTETWSDEAPLPDLTAAAVRAFASSE